MACIAFLFCTAACTDTDQCFRKEIAQRHTGMTCIAIAFQQCLKTSSKKWEATLQLATIQHFPHKAFQDHSERHCRIVTVVAENVEEPG